MDLRGIWRAEVATIYVVNRIPVRLLRQLFQDLTPFSIYYEFYFQNLKAQLEVG